MADDGVCAAHSPTLLVLAAGMGSRYGGIKQMDPVGPSGEFVLDYSMYDAWRAGFSHVVLVIRSELEDILRDHLGSKLDGRLSVTYVIQELDDLPPGYSVPENRRKPWGTGHAIWSARDAVKGPFGVINADDFYGGEAYRLLGEFLTAPGRPDNTFCMVAYRLANTLSRHGSVARGICSCTHDGYLAEVTERTSIEMTDTGARYRLANGAWEELTGDELASLNFWGFEPHIFTELGCLFEAFLDETRHDPKAEFYIPTVVDTLIKNKRCRTAVLRTDEHWFGMTYKPDRDVVVDRIAARIASGVYPRDLWC